jgi:hypothetical protein
LVLRDQSGRAGDATFTGATETDWENENGYCVGFDTNEYAMASAPFPQEISSYPLTMSLWIRPGSGGDAAVL